MTKTLRNKKLDSINFQILWSRIVNISDEMAITLVRTAFSHVVRENQDYGCGLYDAIGRMLGQSTHCTPGHIGAMPIVVHKMLEKYPAETLKPGDVLITNDPWLGAGHTPDFFVTTPVFRDGQLLGFAVNCAHHIDIGGRMGAPDARQVYEEGVIIPITKLYNAGEVNQELLDLLHRNVRMPEKVIGDLRAQVAANSVAARRLVSLVREWRLDDLADLTSKIIDFTEKAMRGAIAEIPDGVYEATTPIRDITEDGSAIIIKVKLTVAGSDIHVDFSGTSPQVNLPINSVYNITYAYTLFPLKCALHPHIPNNEGCARPIHLEVPEGCVLNAQFPAACMWRTSTVYSALEAIFAALSKAIPEKIMAPSGTYPLWGSIFRGEHDDGRSFVAHFNAQGGQGARYGKDGVATTVFPPNVMNTPVELFEAETPMLCEFKTLIPDSGGAGRQRGGNGQRIGLRNLGQFPIVASIVGGRLDEGASGLANGQAGSTGAIRVNGEKLPRSRQIVLQTEHRLELTYPGGGGFGDPAERDIEAVLADVASGDITAQGAVRDYGFSADLLTRQPPPSMAAE
jgi:N-methylhydantoinase B